MEARTSALRLFHWRRVTSIFILTAVTTIGITAFSSAAVRAGSISAKSTDLPAFGDNGANVVRRQQAIIARGFTLKGGVTGIFDSTTRYSLKNLQRVAGFKATGVLDGKTAKFLGLVDVAPLMPDNLPNLGMSGD